MKEDQKRLEQIFKYPDEDNRENELERGIALNNALEKKRLKKQQMLMEHEMRKSLQAKQLANMITNQKLFMLYPDDTLKNLWDAVSSIALLTTCFLTPFNLAFDSEVNSVNWYLWLNYSIDIIFAIDILVIFNSAI